MIFLNLYLCCRFESRRQVQARTFLLTTTTLFYLRTSPSNHGNNLEFPSRDFLPTTPLALFQLPHIIAFGTIPSLEHPSSHILPSLAFISLLNRFARLRWRCTAPHFRRTCPSTWPPTWARPWFRSRRTSSLPCEPSLPSVQPPHMIIVILEF